MISSSFLANLTEEPGIYRLLDTQGNVLYVGKASNLKKRVSSYFNKQQSEVKTRSLVSQVASIEVSVTYTETEALLLESSLIKSLRPKYNILLRDDKSYPYIYLDDKTAFARMEMARFKKKPKKGQCFGPYPSVNAVKDTLVALQKIFKIRNCSDAYFKSRSRPCLQYQIKRCSAPCVHYISQADYQQSVLDAVRFLKGKSQSVLKELTIRLDAAVEQLEFEEAARVRDQMKSLRAVQEQQGVIPLQGDTDVIAIEARPGFACIQCVSLRAGQMISMNNFFPTMPKQSLLTEIETDEALWQQVFSAFVSFYYVEQPERIPQCIITDHSIADQTTLQSMLSDLRTKPCTIQIKVREVKARWLQFARNNLQIAITKHVTSSNVMRARYEALRLFLKIPKDIQRLECFDISHTQGTETVAACVVFNDSGPYRSEYRRFNIQGIQPGDDYAAMEQALMRRYKSPTVLPDVIIIDGGRGQVAVAARVLKHLNVTDVQLLGISKGPTRKAGWEQLILADEIGEITLSSDSQALHLLQHIRDEAHRFAITLHRKKRQKAGFESSLESIEGIGAKRKHALLQQFGGIRELAKAPLEEILKVPGISRELGLRIFTHFHP